MSANGEIPYSRNLFLLALKGQITVHFMDGNTLEGEFAAQDELNIFLRIDDEPLMIPRSQIRYIQGRPGQEVEEDRPQAALLETELERPVRTTPPGLTKEEPYKTTESCPPAVEDLDSTDMTFVISEMDERLADELPAVAEEEKPLAKVVDSEEATFVFPEGMGSAFEIEDLEEDATMVIAEAAEGGDLEEATVVIGEEQEAAEISVRLDCTSGPHAGEVFELKGNVITVGRATDNMCALPDDKEISRHHAIIFNESGKVFIQDQNSLNGVFVNDQRIDSPRQLEDGDAILVGISTLIFHEQ